MLLLLKILTSSLVIVLITEIAKKHALLGGFIAVLPINIMLSLFWLYFENKNVQLLSTFTQSAIFGIFPTLLFLISIAFMFNKQCSFATSVLISLLVLVCFAVLQQRILSHI